jgi:hypothetical protein
MATKAPSRSSETAAPNGLVPPDEKFWKRYSPHNEAPLSMAGSIALHALAFGVLVLFAVYIVNLLSKSTRSLPVDPVRLVGGGGGKKTGTEGGKGVGTGAEDVGEASEDAGPTDTEDVPRRPELNPVETAKVKEEFNPTDVRLISKSETGRALARLQDNVRRKLRLNDGLPSAPKGKGGKGSGGGKGTGKGTGEGSGSGPGTSATLSKREKRMLRWHMRFTANSGPEYLSQLRGLGAILAFPVVEGANPQFKVVHDLRPGGALLDEDISGIQRIYWIDDKQRSVVDILGALGARIPPPSRFVAFMPEKLEQDLFDMEKRYVERVLRRPFNEDLIDETNFRVVPTARGYKPELISVTMRR